MTAGQQENANTSRPKMALATEWWRRFGILGVLLGAKAIALPAQNFITLHNFDQTDGASPVGPLVQATDGNLYGTTSGGGNTNSLCVGGEDSTCGTVFKISPGGTLTILYSFCSRSDCPDGVNPFARLVQATDGNFYGTTQSGGANNGGTIFKITPSGTLTTLYSFCSETGCADGEYPVGWLIQATDGNLYGTTNVGGATYAGTVFKITLNGALTTLYSFCPQIGCADGDTPYAGLFQAPDGNFYGTTMFGGANDAGTVFKITPGGALTTLHTFDSTDGSSPGGGLVQGVDGNLYGATDEGGASDACDGGCGTIFKTTLSGTLTTLHSFDRRGGSNPAGLVQATDGNFYGTAYEGGAKGYGTVFRMTPTGTVATLHSFDNTDGSGPPVLLQDTNGSFYGTTGGGGTGSDCTYGCGTVFALSVGLGPFVEPQRVAGRVGQVIKILGTNLTGATGVTFNGTAATFSVARPSLITATVPEGASTGTIEVVTPSGTLSSNVQFSVLP